MNTTLSNDSTAENGATEVSVREQFIEQSEAWIKDLAQKLPASVLMAAIKGNEISEQVMRGWVSAGTVNSDQIHNVVFLRSVHALKESLENMSGELLLSAATSPTDFGALIRTISNPDAAIVSRAMDPLAGALGRSVQHRQNLAEKAGGLLSSSDVTKILGIKRQAIDKRRRSHKILALHLASGWHYPAFQFENGQVLPGLEKVLNAYGDTDPWVLIDILLARDEALDGRSLLDAVRENDDEAVDRHLRQSQADGFS